jgi:hypothetical protein
MTNTAFSFGANCHVETVVYNHKLGMGAFLVFTRPLCMEAGATRGKAAEEKHKSFVAGFRVEKKEDSVDVYFYDSYTQPPAFVSFLLHTRLVETQSGTRFNANSAEKSLEAWFVKNVYPWAAYEENMPGHTCFVHVTDVSTCTYTKQTTGETKSCFEHLPEGDITYTLTGNPNDTVSFLSLIHEEYKMFNFKAVRQWTCANGSKPVSLHDCLIGIRSHARGGFVDVRDTSPSTDSLSERAHHFLDGRDPDHTAKITLAASAEDIDSLNMRPAPTEVSVKVFFFSVSDTALAGVATIWRNKVRPITVDTLRTIYKDAAAGLDRRSLHGIHNVPDKRDLFVQFIATLGCEVKRIDPVREGVLPRYFLTKNGVAKFQAKIGWHPSEFLCAFEAMAAASAGSANTHRCALFMMNTLVVIQTGDMSPAFDKSSQSDSPKRFNLVLEAVAAEHVKHCIQKMKLNDYKQPLDVALHRGFQVECAPENPPPEQQANQCMAIVPVPPVASDRPIGGTIVDPSNLRRGFKRTAEGASMPQTSANPKRSYSSAQKLEANMMEVAKSTVRMCAQVLGVVQAHEQQLVQDAPGGEEHTACLERIKRVEALKNEAENNNWCLLAKTAPSTLHTQVNIPRLAFANVFYAVVNGSKYKDMRLLDVNTHVKLHKLNTGDLYKFPMRVKLDRTNLLDTTEATMAAMFADEE